MPEETWGTACGRGMESLTQRFEHVSHVQYILGGSRWAVFLDYLAGRYTCRNEEREEVGSTISSSSGAWDVSMLLSQLRR